MGFWEAVKRCMSERYFDFKGRSSRSEFWWFMLFVFLVAMAVSGITTDANGDMTDGGMLMSDWLRAGFSLVFFLPHLGVSVRRLHDIGKSGWWLLVCLVPFIGTIAMIWWGIQPSEQRENRFGLPPREGLKFL